MEEIGLSASLVDTAMELTPYGERISASHHTLQVANGGSIGKALITTKPTNHIISPNNKVTPQYTPV